MTGRVSKLMIPPGSAVFVHQAFRCCPYAAVITSRIHDFLEMNSFHVCETPEEARAAVINTCGFNASRAAQGLRAIRLIRKRAPGIPIIVSGCLTMIERGKVRRALVGSGASALIGPRELSAFDDVFRPRRARFEEVKTNLYKEKYSSKDPRLGLYQVLVSMGCLGRCAYCVIRKAKGKIRSKPLEEVLGEVKRGAQMGYSDIFMVGDDISCYGMDEGLGPEDLLEALSSMKEDCRFSFEAFEPSRFIGRLDDLLPAFSRGRFSWMVFPVQSGSDRILGLMKRSYTRREVERAVARLRDAAPGMIISTDFIFGYPQETFEEFEMSLDLTNLFDYSNFNEYEQRPGTPPPDIPPVEMEPRRARVLDFLRAQGSQAEVLTKNRVLPYDAWTGKDPGGEERMELSRWISVEAAAIREALDKEGGSSLAAGWRLEEVVEDLGGVVLVAVNGESGEKMRLLVTKRDEAAPCMAFSEKYNMSLVSEGRVGGIDEGRMEALSRLGAILGVRQ